MKSFKIIQNLIATQQLDTIKDNYPVGFSIMGSGKILLKFTSSTVYCFDTFEELDDFVLDYMKNHFTSLGGLNEES